MPEQGNSARDESSVAAYKPKWRCWLLGHKWGPTDWDRAVPGRTCQRCGNPRG